MKNKIAFLIIFAMILCSINPVYASDGGSMNSGASIGDGETVQEPTSTTTKETIGTGVDNGEDKFSSSCAVRVTYEGKDEPEPIVINVDLSWGDMLFDYEIDSNSTWNSKTHKYDVTESGKWVVRNDNGNLIKITNYSVIDINAKLGWNKEKNMNSLNGGFYNKVNSLEQVDKITEISKIKSVIGLREEEKEKAISKVYFNISGTIDEKYTQDVSLGEVTVVIK